MFNGVIAMALTVMGNKRFNPKIIADPDFIKITNIDEKMTGPSQNDNCHLILVFYAVGRTLSTVSWNKRRVENKYRGGTSDATFRQHSFYIFVNIFL